MHTRRNNRFADLRILVLSLCALCVLCGELRAQEFKTVHPSVEYAQVDRKIGDDPVKINLLRLDLTKVRLDVKLAMDTVVGTETTSSIATRHGAVAAINSGFFRLDNSIFAGDPSGVLRMDGELFSESTENYPALGIVDSDDQTSVWFVGLTHQRIIEIGNKVFFVGTNRERQDDDIVEYTTMFGQTTLTRPNGIEMIVRNRTITQIFEGTGSSGIPLDGYVISASGATAKLLLSRAKIGDKVESSYWTMMDDARPIGIFKKAADVVSGRGHLLRDAKAILEYDEKNVAFVMNRHPRTAVAKLKDGKFLMITVDGRQPGISVGMNLQELAEYLLGLGAVDAMNLDGGGSTTMFLDGKVVNKPSDPNGERKVGDALIVTLRNK